MGQAKRQGIACQRHGIGDRRAAGAQPDAGGRHSRPQQRLNGGETFDSGEGWPLTSGSEWNQTIATLAQQP